MTTLCLKVRYGPSKSYKLINFDGTLTCKDTTFEICSRYQIPDPELYSLYSPGTAARSALWLEDTVVLCNAGLHDRETIELKYKPHFVHVCTSDGTAQWMQGFTLKPTDRSVVAAMKVDFSDPINEYIPEIKPLLKNNKEELCFQHIFEEGGKIKGRWLNSCRSFAEQDVQFGGFLALVPLSCLLHKRSYDTDEKQEAVKEGFLTKMSIKSHKTTAPKKRWCVVKHNFLFYSASQTQSVPSGVVPLEYYDVHQDTKGKFEFTVRPTAESFGEAHPTYVFECETESELRDWMNVIIHRCTIGAGATLFGVALRKVMRRKLQMGQIPLVVTKTVKYLDEHGLDAQGIFRISGGALSIMRYKDEFDRGLDVDLSKCADVHVAAGLLKLYIRELPEPLIPFELYDDFLNIDTGKPEKEIVADLAKLCKQLPAENMQVMGYVMPFLKRVSDRAEVNQMTVSNLSIVFAPNILRPKEGSPQAASLVQQTPTINKIMETMIQSHVAILKSNTTPRKTGERVSFKLGLNRVPTAPPRTRASQPELDTEPLARQRSAGGLPPVTDGPKSPRTGTPVLPSARARVEPSSRRKHMSQPLTPEMRKQLESDTTRREAPPGPQRNQPRGSPTPGGTRMTLEQVVKLVKQEREARLVLEEQVAQLQLALDEEIAAREALEETVAQLLGS